MKLVVNIGACCGCRTCELACSYHHKGFFSPELSSIKVSTNNRTGEIEWTIDSTCDSCKGEDSPLCVRYCTYQALQEAK
jgi:carbon-monoxide dehydrogenase iron sulfur subunit